MINPGDEVLVPEPCFVSYTADVMLTGGVPVVIGTTVEDEFQVRAADIERAITPATKALLIGYPNNPTGAVLTPERLHEIAAVAERHDLFVISDEIYDRLVYGIKHTHFATLPNMRSRTLVLGGFSKSHAMTGWRLGYAVGPAEIIAPMRKVHQYLIMSAPTTAQIAIAETLLTVDEDVEDALRDRPPPSAGRWPERDRVDVLRAARAFYAFPACARPAWTMRLSAKAARNGCGHPGQRVRRVGRRVRARVLCDRL